MTRQRSGNHWYLVLLCHASRMVDPTSHEPAQLIILDSLDVQRPNSIDIWKEYLCHVAKSSGHPTTKDPVHPKLACMYGKVSASVFTSPPLLGPSLRFPNN